LVDRLLRIFDLGGNQRGPFGFVLYHYDVRHSRVPISCGAEVWHDREVTNCRCRVRYDLRTTDGDAPFGRRDFVRHAEAVVYWTQPLRPDPTSVPAPDEAKALGGVVMRRIWLSGCPYCLGSEVYRSHPVTWLEHAAELFLFPTGPLSRMHAPALPSVVLFSARLRDCLGEKVRSDQCQR
jgi:hypothetical protein